MKKNTFSQIMFLGLQIDDLKNFGQIKLLEKN